MRHPIYTGHRLMGLGRPLPRARWLRLLG